MREQKLLKTRLFLKKQSLEDSEEYFIIKDLDEDLNIDDYKNIRKKAKKIFLSSFDLSDRLEN